MSDQEESEPLKMPQAGGLSDEEAARLWAEFLDEASPHGQAAFDRLYGCFLPVVFRYCRSRLVDPQQAEDIANAVFLRLLERRPRVKSSFIGLPLRTARNLCATESVGQLDLAGSARAENAEPGERQGGSLPYPARAESAHAVPPTAPRKVAASPSPRTRRLL